MTDSFTWSPQQEAAFDWIRNGQGNALLIAVAGAGKTTTIEHMVSMVGGYISVVAYNTKIAKEIQRRLTEQPGQKLTTGTTHSFGLRAWRKVAPDCRLEGPLEDNCDPRFQKAGYWKFDRIVDILGGTDLCPLKYKDKIGSLYGTGFTYTYRTFTKRLMGLAKQYGVGVLEDEEDTEYWKYLVDRFDLDDDLKSSDDEFTGGGRHYMVETGIEYAKKALRISRAIADEVIDYEDMIYMALQTECRVFKVNWLFADECQDMNPTRIALMNKMLQKDGRAIFVGDPCQSIYAFTGAGGDAIPKIQSTFNCIELPLTYSFRCPKSVVAEAQRFVSHIQAADDAPDGSVLSIGGDEFDKMDGFTHNDVILCRNNAPLVEQAYKLIKRGIPCYVEGRAIGEELINLVNRWKIVKLTALQDRLNEYRRKTCAQLMARGHETAADNLNDRVETILTVIAGLPTGCTVSDLRVRITSLFQDSDGNRKKCLTLSSIHKSKGREWDRVFMLGRNVYQPSPYARQDWQKEQENNLFYVMATRSKGTLIDVVLPKGRKAI